MGISVGLPAHSAADNADDEMADPADGCGFQAFAAAVFLSRGLLLEQFGHFFATLSFADAIGKKDPEARSSSDDLIRRRETRRMADLIGFDR